jgi:hypothetical protein
MSASPWYFVKPRDGSPLERVQATLYHRSAMAACESHPRSFTSMA